MLQVSRVVKCRTNAHTARQKVEVSERYKVHEGRGRKKAERRKLEGRQGKRNAMKRK